MKLKDTLKILKLNESLISTILGAVVIIILGIFVINYFSNRKIEDKSSIIVGDEIVLPTKHLISSGEDLWSISKKYYGTGYNWSEIADENNITDPNLISEGQEINIPLIETEDFKITDDQQPTEIVDKIKEVELTPTLGPASQAEAKSTHTIEKGDNLWKIAEKFYDSGYNWVDLAQINNISDENNIEVGDVLIIPSVEPKTPTAHIDESKDPIMEDTYTVNRGDSLWKISVRAYGDGYKWVEVAQENDLDNPNIIHSGNVLSLPR